MRTIKFRAWDKNRKIMIGSSYPDNWGNDKDEWYADVSMMDLCGIENISKREGFEVMQFTGLLDKNGGTEIYEGDVVKTDSVNIQSGTDCNPYLRVVRFNQEEARFDFYQIDGEKQLAGQTFCKNNLEKRWEVIGNIYQNPELLEEK